MGEAGSVFKITHKATGYPEDWTSGGYKWTDVNIYSENECAVFCMKPNYGGYKDTWKTFTTFFPKEIYQCMLLYGYIHRK